MIIHCRLAAFVLLSMKDILHTMVLCCLTLFVSEYLCLAIHEKHFVHDRALLLLQHTHTHMHARMHAHTHNTHTHTRTHTHTHAQTHIYPHTDTQTNTHTTQTRTQTQIHTHTHTHTHTLNFIKEQLIVIQTMISMEEGGNFLVMARGVVR